MIPSPSPSCASYDPHWPVNWCWKKCPSYKFLLERKFELLTFMYIDRFEFSRFLRYRTVNDRLLRNELTYKGVGEWLKDAVREDGERHKGFLSTLLSQAQLLPDLLQPKMIMIDVRFLLTISIQRRGHRWRETKTGTGQNRKYLQRSK